MKLIFAAVLAFLVVFTLTRSADSAVTEITGTFTNPDNHCVLISGQQNVRVHDAVIGPCNGDGIKVLDSTNVVIGPNVTIFDSMNSVSVYSSNYVLVNGVDSTNPTDEGYGVKVNHVHIDHSSNVWVTGGHFVSDVTGMEDGINSYESTGVVVSGATIIGGDSTTGCGIMVDRGSKNARVIGNNLSGEANCGIGVSSGSGHLVAFNTVADTSIPGAWEVYARNFDGGCKNPVFVGNIASFFYDGGDCGNVIQIGNSWQSP